MSEGGILTRLLRRLRGEVPSEPSAVISPRLVRPEDRRREVRMEIDLRVAMRFESIDDVVKSRTVDLSQGGCFLATRSPRAEATRVHLALTVGEREAQVKGVVVHRVTPADAAGQQPGMGVQFTEVGEDARALIDEILARAG